MSGGEEELARDLGAAVFADGPWVVAWVDRDGRLHDANPRLAALTGHALDALRGQPWLTTCVPDADHAVATLALTAPTTEPRPIHALRTAAGATAPLAWHNRPWRRDGQPDGTLCIGVEIPTAPTAPIGTPADAHAALRAIIDAFPGMVGLYQPDGRLIEINARGRSLNGLPRGADAGVPFDQLPHWASDPALLAQVRDAMALAARGGERRFDAEVPLRDGRRLPTELAFAPLRDAAGEVAQIAAFGTDLTERVRVLAAARASEQRFRALFEHAGEGIFLSDASERYVDVNPRGCAMLGYSRDELCAMRLGDLVEPAAPVDLVGLRRDGHAVRARRLRRKDGGWLDVEIAGSMLPDGIMLGMVRDMTAHRQHAEALRLSEQRLAEAHATAHLGSWTQDLTTMAGWWSDEQYRICGISPARTDLTDAFFEVVHPDDRDRVRAGIEQTAREERFDMHFRIVRPDGELRHIHGRAMVIRDADGRARVAGTSQDVTDERLTETTLQLLSTQAARLSGQAFFDEIARQLAQLFGADLGFVASLLGCAPGHARTVGLWRDGATAAPGPLVLAGTPAEEALATTLAIVADGAAARYPGDLLLPRAEVEGYAAVALSDAAGRPIGVAGIASRRQLGHRPRLETILRLFAVQAAAELERQREASRFHDLFELAPTAMIIVDRAGVIVLANRLAEVTFGYPRVELCGLGVDQLVPPAHRTDHGGHRRSFAGHARPRMMGGHLQRFTAVRKDGTTIPVDIGLSQLQGADGGLVLASVRDLTDQVRTEAERAALEAQLRQAQKLDAIGTLAGGIAHDFNNVLMGIFAHGEFAEARLAEGDPAREHVVAIGRAARRAADLVRKILTFSRSQPAQRQRLALGPVVEEVAQLLRASIPASVELAVVVAPDVPAVLADPTQLHQVLLNLGTNAWQAIGGGHGEITLRADIATFGVARLGLVAGRYARLAVTDDGEGIDVATRERIFEPFFTTKPVGVGTGLGLAVVHGIVVAHGGAIEVESAPGRGTTLHVYLPLAPAQAPAAGTPEVAHGLRRGAGQRVLLVDDESDLVRTGGRILEFLGYRALALTSPEEALAVVRADPAAFSLVVTDLAMPRMTGLELAANLEALRPALPVVLVSGRMSEAAAGDPGNIRHRLDKPYTVAELAEVLAQVLAAT